LCATSDEDEHPAVLGSKRCRSNKAPAEPEAAPEELLSDAVPPTAKGVSFLLIVDPAYREHGAFQVFSVKDGIGSKLGIELDITSNAGEHDVVEGLFRFAVPPKFYVAATLPPPTPYERRCKKLPWAEHSLSVAIVVERTLMKVGPGGGAKAQGHQISRACRPAAAGCSCL